MDYSAFLLPRDDASGIQCRTSRSADYYGFGVRLGIYCAWMQAYIANTMIPSEINGALDTNTIFLLTILVAMINCSRLHMLESIDGLILMHLGGGTIFSSLSLWGYRTRRYIDRGPGAIRYFGGWGTHARLIVSMGVSVFGLWFWLHGVLGGLDPMSVTDDVDPPNAPECSILYTFFFAKLRADGGIRIVYIIVCVACCVYFGTMLLASTIALFTRVYNMIALARIQRWAYSTRPRYATGFKYKELRIIYQWLRVLNMIWIIWSIILVECSLNFNNIAAVLTGPVDNEIHLPAQLLPLLIGAFGFIRTTYLAFRAWRGNDEEEEDDGPVALGHRQSRNMKFGVDMLQVFSPAMAKDDERRRRDHDQMDDFRNKRSWPVRYLVATLPWLSLLGHVNDRPQVWEEAQSIRRGQDDPGQMDHEAGSNNFILSEPVPRHQREARQREVSDDNES